ncbi:hypothetical protein [Zobellia sp. OII3]|uniref:hypothetical protein n=1 Tax=Zobellia sp. OII3 TaxID=2034520 RepID=UPI000F4FE8D3|nr:hypothetical protein [Zobellia sp. OII3]
MDEKPVPDPQHSEVDSGPVRIIPLAFDWQNIPEDYSDSVWEIRYDFDLAGQTVILPENVTIRFNGGVLANGTVRGDESVIETKTEDQIFDALDLEGSFTTDYLKPQWFGAAMDGASDDREEFVETLAQAERISAKVLVDRDMFLDLEETGKKSIFLEDNTWIEGANDANIIINNLLSPAFYMALTKNITIKNVTFLYDQKYDATFGWNEITHRQNTIVLTNYLKSNHGLEFESSTALTKSPIAWRSTFYLDAPENVKFENVKFVSKGETADTFIQWAIKLKEEYNPNQKIYNNKGVTRIPKNILLKNVTMDGVIMGVQGVVDKFRSVGLISKRYSDIQDVSGNNVGGSGVGGQYWMHPPHLIYLNGDNSDKYNSRDINIINTIDYGDYVGSNKIRGSHGYCHSLKLVGYINDVNVINYKNYRRDGLWDLENIKNGLFTDIYSESYSDIFDKSYKFNAARFLGKLTHCKFTNITIKDKANTSEIYPWDFTSGDFVTMDNVNIYVQELVVEEDGPFAIFGSNNKIINSSFHIGKHSSKNEHLGVIALDEHTRDNGANNYYDISVYGWRKLVNHVAGNCIKLTYHSQSNPNNNYAKITDVRNNFISEKVNAERKDVWVQTETVSLKNGVEQLIEIKIPNNFTAVRINVKTLGALVTKANVSVVARSSDGDVELSRVSNEIGDVSKSLDLMPFKLNQSIFLKSDIDFKNTGKIYLELDLRRNIKS